MKPQTYMNLSGEAVACLLAKHKLDRARRELDRRSPTIWLCRSARFAFAQRGSAGGHNGLKSIIGALGTNEFIRLRIGIQPEHPICDSKRFVLDSFSRRGASRKLKRFWNEALRRCGPSSGWRFESNDGIQLLNE